MRDGGVINHGFDADLDELRAIQGNCDGFLLELEARAPKPQNPHRNNSFAKLKMTETLLKAKQADLQELESLNKIATRPNIKEFLSHYIQTLSKDIAAEILAKEAENKIDEEEEIKEPNEEKKVSQPDQIQFDNMTFVPITRYGWD